MLRQNQGHNGKCKPQAKQLEPGAVSVSLQVVFSITANDGTEEGDRRPDQQGKPVEPQEISMDPFRNIRVMIHQKGEIPYEQYP